MSGRVLVTGAAGFTGQYVSQALLDKGFEVYGLSHTVSNLGANHQQVDLRDAGATQRAVGQIAPDYVIHLAAVAFVGHTDVAAIYDSNIVGTRNLLAALEACDTPPSKILLASSANIYGNATEGILSEEAAPAPENDYAVSKYAMELMARTWRKRLPIVVVRPFNYTGVGQSPSFLIPKIVGHFVRREAHIELGNIDVYRDFSDVRMVTRAYLGLLEAGEPGLEYNVCTGELYSIKQVLAQLEELAGYSMEVRVNPAFVRANEIRTLAGDPSRLRAAVPALGPIPLEETLAWMYQAGEGG